MRPNPISAYKSAQAASGTLEQGLTGMALIQIITSRTNYTQTHKSTEGALTQDPKPNTYKVIYD